jgi:hypothetical protein
MFLASISYAQEEKEDQDEITDLPAVKIEIQDTTQIYIPKERFRSFTKPSTSIYTPLPPKERPWYLPPTLTPDRIREETVPTERDFLFSLSGYSGVPTILAYQMLLVRGFGKSEGLLDMGRMTFRDERTAESGDASKTFDNFTVDKLKGAFTHQEENFNVKVEAQYNARELGYMDGNGQIYPNDRSLVNAYVDWDQDFPNGTQSSFNLGLSSLNMEGPVIDEDVNGLDLKSDLRVKFFLPRANPIYAGLTLEYLNGEGVVDNFTESLVKLYLRDNYIRFWAFILGVGAEVLLDARKSEENADWDLAIYPNPYLLLMSQLGNNTIIQLSIERLISSQNFKALYLNKDYVRFNPNLSNERIWNISADLQYRFTRKSTISVGAFDKEIRNLTFFERIDDNILSWMPETKDSARIFGFKAGWELLMMDERLKSVVDYIHEFHDSGERIPYRPQDRGSLSIIYYAPFGFELSLSGEFNGIRYVRVEEESETLSSYFILSPRISKDFSRYASLFLSAGFYIGEDDYQVWDGYKLPSQTIDFGLKLKF